MCQGSEKANTGLAAALPSLSLDPPGGRVKNDVKNRPSAKRNWLIIDPGALLGRDYDLWCGRPRLHLQRLAPTPSGSKLTRLWYNMGSCSVKFQF